MEATCKLAAGGALLGSIAYYLYSSSARNVEEECASEKAKEASLPFTERANEMTNEIDTADAQGIVRILRQTDAQVYVGWREHSGLNDQTCLHAIDRVAEAVHRAVVRHASGGKAKVICAGCGTSGRIAFQVGVRCRGCQVTQPPTCCPPLPQVSRSYQPYTPGTDRCFEYLISGGDGAVVASDELPEDDPNLGRRELQALLQGDSFPSLSRKFRLRKLVPQHPWCRLLVSLVLTRRPSNAAALS
jgi:hypothetical protein